MSTIIPTNKSGISLSRDDLNELGVLLKPSWLSGLIAVVVSLVIVVGTVAMIHYNGSSWQLLLSHQQHHTVESNSVAFEQQVTKNVFVSNLPLLVFWAGVGMIVYSFIIALSDVFRNVLELKEEMHYVHANRKRLLRQAVLHLVLRATFLAVWVACVHYTIHVLLPYIIALAYAGSGDIGWLYNSTYLVGALIISAISLHLHTVLLRLVLLKPRLFGQAA